MMKAAFLCPLTSPLKIGLTLPSRPCYLTVRAGGQAP